MENLRKLNLKSLIELRLIRHPIDPQFIPLFPQFTEKRCTFFHIFHSFAYQKNYGVPINTRLKMIKS